MTWLPLVIGIVGIWLIASGVWVLGARGRAGRWNEVIPGILLVLFAFLASQILEGVPLRLYTRDGVVMVETSHLERRRDDLVMWGKLMGAMSATISPFFFFGAGDDRRSYSAKNRLIECL